MQRLLPALCLLLVVQACKSNAPEADAVTAMKDSLVAMQAHDADRAEELAKHALELRPGFIDPLMMLAALEEQRGDYEAARGHYRDVLEADPTDTAAGVALGFTYLREGRFPEARDWFTKAIDSDPGCEAAAYNLGSLSEHLGMHEEAVSWFEISAVLDRRDPRALVRIAGVRMAQGRPEEALAAAEEALVRYPESMSARAARATSLHALGRE